MLGLYWIQHAETVRPFDAGLKQHHVRLAHQCCFFESFGLSRQAPFGDCLESGLGLRVLGFGQGRAVRINGKQRAISLISLLPAQSLPS